MKEFLLCLMAAFVVSGLAWCVTWWHFRPKYAKSRREKEQAVREDVSLHPTRKG